MLRRLIGESIHMHTAFDAELWNVKADPGQLEQVLVNLVVNARDAIEDHGRIEIRTANLAAADCGPELPSSLSPADYVMLSVRDTGRGMSDVVRSKLFEPFFTTKERGEGTGLGLATVYGAAQQNGGAVAVESKLGAGSTFTIFLPRHVGVEEEHYASPPPVEKVAAHSGPIDLLLTDVVMPRMNGKELAARVAALRPGLAVLFTSGYGEKIIAKEGVLDLGVNFIGKPYRPVELAETVRRVLDRRAEALGLAARPRSE